MPELGMIVFGSIMGMCWFTEMGLLVFDAPMWVAKIALQGVVISGALAAISGVWALIRSLIPQKYP